MKKDNESTYRCIFKSPIGVIQLRSTIFGLSELFFSDELIYENINNHLIQAVEELDQYFTGKLRQFKTPLHLQGSEFQKKVWQKLRTVSYGNTLSYKDLSIAMQNEKAIRAIAAANGKNPIALMIPCHRIIGSNQKMVGYAWGLERKLWLLDFEKKQAGIGQQTLFT